MKRLALEKLFDYFKITIEAMTLLDLDLNGVQMSISQVRKKRRIIIELFSRYLICFYSGEIFLVSDVKFSLGITITKLLT